ncbi:MAG: hypothetical protein PHY47_14360 [Lachnospiraceae bacterium]|nr:hypothetical protein [Lachnospiraceae bacterium]
MNIYKTKLSTAFTNDVYKIHMNNDRLWVDLLTLGACIQKVALSNDMDPSADGDDHREKILNLSFADLHAYEACQEYAGMTIGPNAGRVSDTSIEIDRSPLALSHNEGTYSLHGGYQNISKSNWHILEMTSSQDICSVTLETFQADGVDGWPGNRHYQVRYTLSNDNCLAMDYHVTTDRDTYVNLTNHTYWNLTGDPHKALSQRLCIDADQVCVNGEDHLPLFLRYFYRDSEDYFDFRKGKEIGDICLMKDAFTENNTISTGNVTEMKHQLLISKGLNHGFSFASALENEGVFHSHLSNQYTLSTSDGDISMQLSTDAPGVVVYSGGFIPSGLPLSDGQLSVPNCGIALEAQELPTVAPYHLTTPENPFHRSIRFQFRFSS